jgi:hypothetical protein
MDKEICICAAVIANGGTIIRGHRHVDCLYTIKRMKLKPTEKNVDQGFITSRNRYVDRKEGYKLQIAAGIKSIDSIMPYMGEELFSEDLY